MSKNYLFFFSLLLITLMIFVSPPYVVAEEVEKEREIQELRRKIEELERQRKLEMEEFKRMMEERDKKRREEIEALKARIEGMESEVLPQEEKQTMKKVVDIV